MTSPKIQFTWQLSIGHVLQVVAIITAGMVFALRLEARIDVQEVRANELQGSFERSEARTNDTLQNIQQNVRDIRDRLFPRDH